MARELPAGEFQDEIVRQLRPLFRFDSSMWGSGMISGDRLIVHSIHLHNQPAEMIENWETVNHEDTVSHVASSHLGRVVNVHAPSLFRGNKGAGMRAHNQRFEIANCLVIGGAQPGTPLRNWVSLFRRNADEQFSRRESRMFQSLFPHLVEALTINRLLQVGNQLLMMREARPAVAIVDRVGFIYTESGNFSETLRRDWPSTGNGIVPKALMDAIAGAPFGEASTKSIAVSSEPVGDLLLLRLRNLGPVDRLSARERQVAQGFGTGMSHKEIAKQLGISPATARNYIQIIYAKLGITDKASLATLLANSRLKI